MPGVTISAGYGAGGSVVAARVAQLLDVPLFIEGKAEGAQDFKEETFTLTVSAHGALIVLAAKVALGQTVRLTNLKNKDLAKNRPNQPGNSIAANRPSNPSAGNLPANKPANRAADPARGFAKDNSSTGGRNSALGGYEPGGNARASRDRGQSSFQGNQRPAGGRGNGGGGGNANRGGGGGNSGGNRGGGKKGR